MFRMADVPLTLYQDYLARNQQVYETMWGPSNYSRRRAEGLERGIALGEIDVPTLILSGRYDEATRRSSNACRRHPGSRWTILEHSAHLTFLEEPERYREVLSHFSTVDRAGELARSSAG